MYLGIALIAGVIFGRNAMQPADLAAAAVHSRGFRMVIWALWLFGTAPAAHALFHTRELEYLRWLPMSRGHIPAVLAALLAVLHAPWALLWALGQGATGMLAALTLAVAVHALASVRFRNGLELALGLALLAAAALALALPLAPGVVLAGSAVAALVAVPAAWARAPEQRSGRAMMRVASHPLLALAQTLITGLIRTRPAVLARGVIVASLGAALTVVVARANDLAAADVALYASFVGAIALALATAGLAAPLAEIEHALGWLLQGAGASHDLCTGARVLAAGLAGGVLGAIYAGLVIWGAGALGLLGAGALGPWNAARVMGEAVALGAAMALIARWSARWIEPSPGTVPSAAPGVDSSAGGSVDGSRVVVMVTLATIAALIAIAVLGDLAVLALLGLGVAVSVSGRPA